MFSHITFGTNDIERARRFYAERECDDAGDAADDAVCERQADLTARAAAAEAEAPASDAP